MNLSFHLFFNTRRLSTDNTINIIFRILASILGILSVGLAWLAIYKGASAGVVRLGPGHVGLDH